MRQCCSISVLLFVLSAVPASADDKADCQAGITTIQADIDKASAQEVLEKLHKALTDAMREFGEEGI